MNNFEQLIPLAIGITISWFVLRGVFELLKETSVAFGKKSAA